MTAQISDTVFFEGERYDLAGIHGTGLFEPAGHGLEPQPMHTACWRGFHCDYAFEGDVLVLRTLHIALGVGPRPTLWGHPPTRNDGAAVLVYDRLNAPMPFTGKLRIGREFIASTYVHMGFSQAYQYRHVYELALHEGRVFAREDRSPAMAEERRSAVGGPTESGDAGIMAWIRRRFDLGFDPKGGRGRS